LRTECTGFAMRAQPESMAAGHISTRYQCLAETALLCNAGGANFDG
jgi:hypothetical protein